MGLGSLLQVQLQNIPASGIRLALALAWQIPCSRFAG